MNAKPKVYLVDDDPLILESLEANFQFSGFDVETFNDSGAFLATDIDTSESCLILDLRMPNMSGLELQRELRNRGENMPVIIYSGNADVVSAVKAMEDGALTLIQKPVPVDSLISKTREAIRQHQQQHAEQRRYKEAAEKLASLSEREKAVADLVAEGYSATRIADKLFISNRTVEAHKASIFRKLNINSVTSLTQMVLLAELANQQ